MLKYCIIIPFQNSSAVAVTPMQFLLLCSNYAHFIIEKHLELEEGQASLPHCPDTGCCLTCFSEFNQLSCLIYLLPRNDLHLYLAIIPA